MFLSSRNHQSISVLSADALKKRVAEKVIQLRKLKGFTQADMAAKFNMSQVAYAKIENCKTDINLEKTFLFCEILEITLIELFGLDQVMSVHEHNLVSELTERIIRQENSQKEKEMLNSLLVEKIKRLETSLNQISGEFNQANNLIESIEFDPKQSGIKAMITDIFKRISKLLQP
ncbi:MAG: helix-turn-helix transcriptional regulator [Bacteroidota bacterium]|nr:helix-turn-helix transcriptional regulator [Bacteroidota bacterium]